MFEAGTDGIRITSNRRFQVCNRAFEELFGYAPGEMIGLSTRVIYPSDEAYQALGSTLYPTLAQGRVFVTEAEPVNKTRRRPSRPPAPAPPPPPLPPPPP